MYVRPAYARKRVAQSPEVRQGAIIRDSDDSARLQSIAALSRSALARNLGTFLDETVLAVTETAGADCCTILEFLPDGDGLRLRAGVGCRERRAGHRCVTRSGERGPGDAMEVTIGDDGLPWGLLVAHSARPGVFGATENDFVRTAANLIALATHRQDANTNATHPRGSELLQTIFNESPVMITFRDPAGQLLYANRAWEQTLGWTVQEARQIDFLAEVYPDPAARSEVRLFMERSDRQWADFRMRTRGGRSVDSSWVRFRLSDGSTIGFGLDLTDSRKAERALADSESRFAKLFQASPVALAIFTVKDGRVLDVNGRWLAIFGYQREEVIGRTNAELNIVPETTRDDTTAEVRGDLHHDLELRVRTKSGELRDLIVSNVPVDIAHEEEAWISAQVDITDRKRAEADRDRLLESEKVARAEAELALERLHAIESITDTALQNLGLDELLREMLARVMAALNGTYGGVTLLDDRRRELYSRVMVGPAVPPNIGSVRIALGKGVAGKVAVDGQPRNCHELAELDFSHVSGITKEQILATSRSMICAPLRLGSRIVGTVEVSSPRSGHFDDDDLKLLLLVADRVAPAIERARLNETVRVGRSRLKALSARLLTAQEEERRRLAVELHDELGQVLTAVKINLQSAARRSESRCEGLDDAIASVDQALERVRGIALDLHPSILDDLGLPAALRWYTDRFARDAGIQMRFSADAAHRLDPPLETACFRVVQEALTNVARHAHARRVSVRLKVGAGGAVVKIRDDGVGFDVAAARERAAGVSLGLLGMEERVSSFGGELEVQSAQGRGTEILARFPSAPR